MVTVTSASLNHIFDNAKIIVIKVGSSLLVDEDQNAINTAWLSGIATDIARLKAAGKDVVVVSSGAIALGRRLLSINHNKLKLIIFFICINNKCPGFISIKILKIILKIL